MKFLFLTIALYLVSFGVFGQAFSKSELRYKPQNLNEAVLQLNKVHHDITKMQIIKMTEEQFSLSSHFGLGTWIRNKWRLWGNGKLSKYFKSIGVFHPDDMSGIILTSYYRYLKGQDRALDSQVKYYQNYWNESKKHFDRLDIDSAYRHEYQQKIRYTLDSLNKEDIKKSVNCFLTINRFQ